MHILVQKVVSLFFVKSLSSERLDLQIQGYLIYSMPKGRKYT